MNPGDNFVLCVYDASEGEVYCSDTEFDQWTNENGTIMPAYSDWTAVYAFESSGGGDGNTIVPDDDFAGNLSVPVYVDDGEAENSQSNTFELTVSVIAANEPPVADNQSVSVDEDGSVDITLTGSDPDGDELNYTVTSGPSNGSLSGDAPNVSYSPNNNYNGDDSFTFSVSDGEYSDDAAVSITVNAVNDAPSITGGDDLSTPEATALTITLGDLSVEDIDNNYPDGFTLTVLDGDNYSLQGGSGSAPYSLSLIHI